MPPFSFRLLKDHPIHYPYRAPRRLGHLQIVGDHHYGMAHFIQFTKKLQDFFSASGIQCPGGFIRKQNGRL